VLLLHK